MLTWKKFTNLKTSPFSCNSFFAENWIEWIHALVAVFGNNIEMSLHASKKGPKGSGAPNRPKCGFGRTEPLPNQSKWNSAETESLPNIRPNHSPQNINNAAYEHFFFKIISILLNQIDSIIFRASFVYFRPKMPRKALFRRFGTYVLFRSFLPRKVNHDIFRSLSRLQKVRGKKSIWLNR